MVTRIAVLTSGGDVSGMNAAIRGNPLCTRSGWEVFGVQYGYAGLIKGSFQPLNARSVGGIIHQGSTFLGSARCPECKTEDGRLQALYALRGHHIDGLVVIGGNSSQRGAYTLSQLDFPVVGVASTIRLSIHSDRFTEHPITILL